MNSERNIWTLLSDISETLDFSFLAGTMVLVVMSFLLVRFALIPAIYKALERTETTWDEILKRRGVFRRLSFVAPAIVLYYAVQHYPAATSLARQFILIYIILDVIIIANRFLSAAVEIYRLYPISMTRPIRAYVQLVKLMIYVVGAVTIVALLLGKSPWGVLGGIGAMTAVLILVFRNTVLSLIASIQLVANDLLHRGDWIELPNYGADGEVIDMSLHSVTVQCWDKSHVTIPAYKFMDESFKNWRGMQQAGGRRIKRSLLIDQNSVRFCDDKLLSSIYQIPQLKPLLETKHPQFERTIKNLDDGGVAPHKRMLTNLGVFRAYASAYLNSNPDLSEKLIVMVRYLQPTSDGLPVEIYAFSTKTDVVSYEHVQSGIIDHLLSVLPYFELQVFQHPTGRDLSKNGA